MKELTKEELLQKQHYDNIAVTYELHYSDEYGLQYRNRFINEPMVENINLNGLAVLDAMCGGGQTTQFLLTKGAKVTGLDISPEVISTFKNKWEGVEGFAASIFDSKLESASFDCVAIVGGLHHLHPDVDKAIDEIYRILKPGGYLCFMEPHTGALPDLARKVWYKFDKLFERNEAAIDVIGLQAKNAARFNFVKTNYSGNLAYLLVLNSLVFRIPVRLKKYYSPFLIKVEAFINKFQGRFLSCFVVAQWRKKV